MNANMRASHARIRELEEKLTGYEAAFEEHEAEIKRLHGNAEKWMSEALTLRSRLVAAVELGEVMRLIKTGYLVMDVVRGKWYATMVEDLSCMDGLAATNNTAQEAIDALIAKLKGEE